MTEIILRTIFFYLLIVFTVRLLGKREVGELSIADLIVLLIIADIAVISIENVDQPVYLYVVAIFTVALSQKILSFLALKNNKIRFLVDGKPSLIIRDGKLNIKEMQKQKYTVDDLVSQTREKGIASLHDVDYAILETSGELSVFLKGTLKPLPVIISGEIVEENLEFLNKSEEWLKNQVYKNDINLSDIYYASIVDEKLIILDHE
ncbi:DUF421 domain-containing protein [Mycoplasmatota bacterium]|nr:DUF421 domain-containing protein [Mycoplasmatota bacterium]